MIKINFLKKEKRFTKKTYVLNANFYWRMAGLIMLGLGVISAIHGYLLFREISEEFAATTGESTIETNLINIATLEKTLNYFSDREQKRSQILNSAAPVVDPSQ